MLAVLALAATPVLQERAGQPPARPDQREPIRVGVDLITTDVIVRDGSGRFMANLERSAFDVLEDGVRQAIVSFVMVLGGRVFNETAPMAPAAREGLILPQPRREAAGRVFVIFIDDLHLDGRNTPRLRHLLGQISTELIHDGDMFAVVSTGYSSIAIDLTYDRKRLDQAIEKVTGGGLTPKEILEEPESAQGAPQVRHRAHVAFRTAWDLMQQLQQVQQRRKAFVYISNGYDFAPFQQTRARLEAERFGRAGEPDSTNPFLQQRNQFSDADLATELAELTRAANRANATIYTIDPRGLVAGPDLDQDVNPVEWQNYVTGAQNSLRVLADLTGGIAIVNRNDYLAGLRRIDNETSDYYILGYYSNNPDAKKRRRTIEVRVNRPGAVVLHRTEYALAPRGR
ncbi:MAG TPA: VWA domain-containing protein [Vicinamibacterales bacterium]|nr:VWA domain-containing protein [Vicinamibacterales bacterium]